MKHAEALEIANGLVAYFEFTCVQMVIAGSVRRGKPDVKDIEIVAIPNLSLAVPKPRLEFGKPAPVAHKTMIDKLLHDLVEHQRVRIEKSGERYKKFEMLHEKISVDLFLVLPPAAWGVQLAIRTGPADFSHWMVTRKRNGGALPNGYRVQDGAVWEGEHETKSLDDQVLIGFDSEVDFLNFMGLGWIEPSERAARWSR